jgi:hypothetical protein
MSRLRSTCSTAKHRHDHGADGEWNRHALVRHSANARIELQLLVSPANMGLHFWAWINMDSELTGMTTFRVKIRE